MTPTINRERATSSIAVASFILVVMVIVGKNFKRSRTTQSTPIQCPNPKSHLLRLPVEIREMIYEFAMRQGGHLKRPLCATTATTSAYRSFKKPFPAVCFLSRVESSVAISVFIRSSDFYLFREGDAAILFQWLRKLRALHLVRQLHISYIPQHRHQGFAKDLKSLRQCDNLKEVRISIPLDALSLSINIWGRDGASFKQTLKRIRLLTLAELESRFQLNTVLKCKGLRKIRLIVWSDSHWCDTEEDRGTAFVEHVENIKNGFYQKHGKELEIALQWASDEGMPCECLKCVRSLR